MHEHFTLYRAPTVSAITVSVRKGMCIAPDMGPVEGVTVIIIIIIVIIIIVIKILILLKIILTKY